jgi:hypothetical protein
MDGEGKCSVREGMNYRALLQWNSADKVWVQTAEWMERESVF